MSREKTTTEELYEHMGSSDSSLGPGKWSFHIICKFCQHAGDLPSKPYHVRNERHMRRAAMKFVQKGWGFDQLPVCPSCASQIGQ